MIFYYKQLVGALAALTGAELVNVAAIMGRKPSCADTTIQLRSFHKHYRDFTWVSSKGKQRKLSEPVAPLKHIQQRINKVLRSFTIPWVSSYSVDDVRNIIRTKTYGPILTMDIKDFFPSVTNLMVLEAFAYITKCRTILAQESATIVDYVMHNGKLPQGAPTSPIVADIAMISIDEYLRNYLNKYIPGATYIRYVDNFFILLPENTTKAQISKCIGTTKHKLRESKLELNKDKTAVMSRGRAMNVLGLTANPVAEVSNEITIVKGERLLRKKVYVTYSAMRVSRKYIEATYRDICDIYLVADTGYTVDNSIYYKAIGRLQYIRHHNKRLKQCFSTITQQLVDVTDNPYAKTLYRLTRGMKKERRKNDANFCTN